jgi:WhiB family redox-sensing transcriptional regulator
VIGEWRKDAACQRIDPEIMYPSHDTMAIRAAKDVCRACPVVDACLAEALARGETEGVWGGMTPEERALHDLRLVCSKCAVVFRPRNKLQRMCDYCRHVPRRRPAMCGTRSGYEAHVRRREPVCEPCEAAKRDYNRASIAKMQARAGAA